MNFKNKTVIVSGGASGIGIYHNDFGWTFGN
jgi:short-subunit dehydrogenase involved in D-alanine esterification of teichoic acids